MADTLTIHPPAPPSAPSLFEGVAGPAESYCEAFDGSGRPRAHWQPLVAAFDARGAEDLARSQERVRRMRHEDGATYNLFDDPSGRGIPWALEMIPLPLTAGEWSEIEAGLTQRAFLLDRVLADLYGPQQLLQEGALPPELIFANPRFLHPCHGIKPAGGRFLAFYAADLIRGPDGRFRVLRDYAASPAGMGYALENRIVISRVFPELYHRTQIRRLAPFFQALHNSLVQRAFHRRVEPGIVMLSPGPDCRIYFEHALLSRYLGYPLVEGQDLTVRNGKVLLKKLAGLEPVEVMFRLLDDDRSDPLVLRLKSDNGVAGLIQAAREQQIDLVNPIGSGFADTPVLPVFLPALCRRLLKAELLLESHPAWWAGNPEGRTHILEHLAELCIAPAFHSTADPFDAAELPAAVQAEPHRFMARAPIHPSVVPAWDAGALRPRFCLLRIFACAGDQGYVVMPGGLAVTAADAATLIGGVPEQQMSKDIWVLSDRPVEPFSLMAGLQASAELKRGSDLPSRVADHLLWLGRYLERAEGLVRLLRSVLRRLSGEARPGDIPELSYLLNLLRAEQILPAAPDAASEIPRFQELSAQLNSALYRPDRPESVAAVLNQIRESARRVRDRLSLDSWRVINRLSGLADSPAGDPLEFLNDTLFTLSAFSGLAMESMTRGLGWRFMDMGRRIERGIHHARLIRIGLSRIGAEPGRALEALLEVSDSIMTYRARYRSAFQLAPALDLLLLDESNPKSLAFQCSRIAAHVEHLPRQSNRRFAEPEERKALEMLTAVRLLDPAAMARADAAGPPPELAAFLESVEAKLKDFAQQISAHYLSRVPATPHFSALGGNHRP